VTEDVFVLALGKNLAGRTGVGGSLRFQRGAVGNEANGRVEAEIGIHHRASLPLTPRLGLAIRGIGGHVETLGGVELSLPPLASARIPLRVGYGFQAEGNLKPMDHRVSLRASWMDQLQVGMGFSFLEDGDGWNPLWMLGADLGRYSLSVLRESLANGFGPVHFLQAAIRFP
jgi:hypothetical protein